MVTLVTVQQFFYKGKNSHTIYTQKYSSLIKRIKHIINMYDTQNHYLKWNNEDRWTHNIGFHLYEFKRGKMVVTECRSVVVGG